MEAGVQTIGRSLGRSLSHWVYGTGTLTSWPLPLPGQPRGVWFGKQSTCFYELNKGDRHWASSDRLPV